MNDDRESKDPPAKSRTKKPDRRRPFGRRSGDSAIPWTIMRETYVCDETQTYEGIAKQFKVSGPLVRRRAAQEGWMKEREEHLLLVVKMTRERSMEMLVSNSVGIVRDILEDTARIRKMAIAAAEKALDTSKGMGDVEGLVEERETIPPSVDPGGGDGGGTLRGERVIVKTKKVARAPIDSKLVIELVKNERDIVLAILGKQGPERTESEVRIE